MINPQEIQGKKILHLKDDQKLKQVVQRCSGIFGIEDAILDKPLAT